MKKYDDNNDSKRNRKRRRNTSLNILMYEAVY